MILQKLKKMTSPFNKGDVIKLVITGGPCGGKSTIIPILKEKTEKLGVMVATLIEVPTLYSKMGFQLGEKNPDVDGLQKSMFQTQIFMEEQIYKYLEGKQAVILLDRGIMDYKVYSSSNVWRETLLENRLTEKEIYTRYDLVCFLDSLACSSNSYYELARYNNPARFEDAEQARENNKKLYRVWKNFPNFFHFSSDVSIDEKIDKILSLVREKLGK